MATTDATPESAAALIAPRSARSAPAEDRARSAHERLRDLLVIGGPALLALGLCLYDLAARSLWLDESATVAIASQHGGGVRRGARARRRQHARLLRARARPDRACSATARSCFGCRRRSRRGDDRGLVGALGATAVRPPCVALAAGLLSRRQPVARLLGPERARLRTDGGADRGVVPGVRDRGSRATGRWRAWIAYVRADVAAVYAGLEAVLVVPGAGCWCCSGTATAAAGVRAAVAVTARAAYRSPCSPRARFRAALLGAAAEPPRSPIRSSSRSRRAACSRTSTPRPATCCWC